MNKPEARARARAALRAMDGVTRRDASGRIARHVWSVPEICDARVLLLYASTAAEVDTDAIAAEALRRGMSLVYPRCLPATRELTLHELVDLSQLRDEGVYGIREPLSACTPVQLARIDAALVPGLGWDRKGNRLGRGAGYYDRLFARVEWRAFRCGLFFATQELGAIPSDPWDRPLDAVVTERGVVRFTQP